MKKILHFFLSLILIFTLFSCTQDIEPNSIVDLVISVNDTQKKQMSLLVDEYNNKYQGQYHISFEEHQTESIKNYRLYHNDIKGDVIAFDSFNEANDLGNEYLIDLTLDDAVDFFQSNVINYLKDNNERLYVFPSVGRIYSNIYNLDLMNRYSYLIPKTLAEQELFYKRAQSKLNSTNSKTASTIGSTDSILFALMQVAFPNFLSSTKGTYFLREYTDNKTTMANDEYINYFKEIFKQFRQLYDFDYYSLDDVNNDINKGIEEFINNETMVLQTTIDYQYNDIFNEMNSSIEPFVGIREEQNWIASKPLFYLSVNKNIKTTKYKAAKAFFSFYASNEGQNLLSRALLNSKDMNNDFYISYVKDSYLNVSDEYKSLFKPLEEGRVFIVDTFFNIFSNSIDLLIDYIKKNITVEELIQEIDSRNSNKLNSSLVNVDSEFDYNQATIKKAESKIQNYLTDTIRKYSNSFAVIIDNDAINTNIYSNKILKSDFNIIFKNKSLVYIKLDVSDLYSLIQKYLNKKEIPFISGIRINNENGKLQIYNQANNLLTDGTYTILIDEDILRNNNIDYDSTNKLYILTIFFRIINDDTTINASEIDNRYGNINFKDSE